MITADHPLIQLLALIDMVWVEAASRKGKRGVPKLSSEKTMFKVYISAFATAGPVWHKQDKEAGLIREGLPGLDTEADWIQSPYHGWVSGDKAHVSISVAPTTVRLVLGATVTG